MATGLGTLPSILLAATFALVAGLGGCAPASDRAPSGRDPRKGPPVELMRQLSKVHEQYIAALLLCGRQPSDWEQAKQELALISPYHVFDEDLDLIRKFSSGDDNARKELARRGQILSALSVFSKVVDSKPFYNKETWERAQKTLMDAGEPGQILLSTTLIQLLINGQYQDIWDHIRLALVETGPVAFETLVAWARQQVNEVKGDTPIFRLEEMTQTFMGLIFFGDPGVALVREFAASPKVNVRRACARAIGEAVHVPSSPVLVRMMSEDPEWAARTMAAAALGKMVGAKAIVGPALLDRMKKERDRIVLRVILESLGNVKYEDAVPDLIKVLDHPNVDVANDAMMALYHITGFRMNRKAQWLEWYTTAYPSWRDRPRR